MKITQEIHTQIVQYLNDELTKAEQEAFELKLTESPDLQKEVEFNRKINAFIQRRKDIQYFTEIAEEVKAEENKKIRSFKWRYWAVAASILVLLLILFQLNRTNMERITEEQVVELYNQFKDPNIEAFAEYAKGDAFMGRKKTDVQRENFNRAIMLYATQNFSDYLSLIDSIHWDNSYKPLVEFYAARSLMESSPSSSNSLELAITYLKPYRKLCEENGLPKEWPMEKVTTITFCDEVSWRLSLLLLKTMSFQEMQKLLDGIASNPNSKHQDQALDLISKLGYEN